MTHYGKWVAGGFGFLVGGPIGALVGIVIGAIVDNQLFNRLEELSPKTSSDYLMSLLVLIAATLKADGKILRSELEYVKRFFISNFGENVAKELLLLLRDLVKKDIPVEDVALQIKQHFNHSERLQLLHLMFGVAAADGEISKEEVLLIQKIAHLIDIDNVTYTSIKAMFEEETDSAYKVLGIEKSATDAEVKKAYRAKAVEYHPDKVSNLGEDIQKSAKEKFQKLNQAYEKIKKERGIK